MARAGTRAARIGTAVAASVLLTGCSGSSSPDQSDPSGGPGKPPNAEPAGAVAADPATSAAGVVLAEVGLSARPGDKAFVEIANLGDEPVDLANLRLVADGRPVDVPQDEPSLDPGARLLVTLDELLDPSVGDVLLSADEQLVDSVVWGTDRGGAVSMAVGDFVPATVDPGTTIGRPPGADQPLAPTEWVVYPPAEASPGEVNPVPAVAVLLPVDGAILEAADSTLGWYPVRGAASYRVQVATEPTFADPLLDATVAEATVDVGGLDPGTYTWRVQALDAGGDASAPSEPSTVTLGAAANGRPTAVGNPLNVPFLAQRKDTTMLLLESPHETQPMAWDAPHNPPNGKDPADNKNCAIAMIAMINRFFGGDLSQDRIGYEIFKDRRPGPEEDLNYGYGLTSGGEGEDQTLRAFEFALGAPVGFTPGHESMDDVWGTIVNAIDGGQPVAAAGTTHGYVVKGYEIRNGSRTVIVNDPARGTYKVDLDTPGFKPQLLSLWTMPERVTARKQEPGVTKDSDGDKVVDFDETERFHTDPAKKDTDDDKVEDKRDVAAGVFDPTHGYALRRDDRGRDFDGDDRPTELDPDSDDGGCPDGDEDANRDGRRSGDESWNFDAKDDVCGDLAGTITWTLDETRTGPRDLRASSKDVVTLSVRFDERDGDWVDAGSSYTWVGSSQLDTNPGDDPEAGYCNELHISTTTTGGGVFETSLASSIFVDVFEDVDEVAVSSWVAGELKTHKETGTWTSDGTASVWCELVPSDSTQGGGSTADSQAEWGQVPRCLNFDEWVAGAISDDGRTAVFDCEDTETHQPGEGATTVTTMTVHGQLTFAKSQ